MTELTAQQAVERIEAALAMAPTAGPWQVVTTEHPHHLGGKHTERRVFTTWHHPQMKGPLGVVNSSIGIGPEKGGRPVHMVSVGEADAALIAAANPAALALLLAERRELLARQSENAEIIAVHDKLQAGRLGMHPLIAAMCQVAAGASMDEAMRGIGYGVARQVPEWLPMETAPKDGTEIFCYWLTAGVNTVSSGSLGMAAFDGGRWCNPEDENDYFIPPTHWMPLPAPPSPTAAD